MQKDTVQPFRILILQVYTMSTPFTTMITGILKRFLSALILSFAPYVLAAQDATPSTLLPDIDPQDIEIRGEFQARFPGIMRQPILGFNPRPRVFQIDPNRMPFIETPEQVVASLPISELDRPAPPSYQFHRHPERFRLWSTTGIGNYMAPEADVYLELPVSDRTIVTGNFHNLSSGSYLEDDSEQTSSFRNMNGGLGVIHYAGKRSRFDLGLTGRADRNHLPRTGARPVLGDAPYNNIGVLGANLGYRYSKNAFSFWDVALDASSFNTNNDVFYDFISDDNRFKENRIGAAIRKDWATQRPGNVLSITSGVAYADYELLGYTTSVNPVLNEVSDSWMVANAGLAFRTRIGYALRASVGGRFFYAQDAIDDGSYYLYPELTLEYQMLDRLKLSGAIEGFVRNQGLIGHSEVNRRLYSYGTPENERGFSISSSAEYEIMEGFKVQSGINYTRYNRHSVFSIVPNTAELLTYRYIDDANVFKWDISTWYDVIPEKLHAFGGVYVQTNTDDDGNRIAFRENIGASAGGVLRYTDRTRFHLWADYTGSRKIAPGRSENGYFLLNAKVDVWASRDIGAYVKITNLLNQSYTKWVGYDELPAQVYGGVMIKF